MNTIKIVNFSPVISSAQIGESIYNEIKKSLVKNEKVEINFDGVKSMATFCSKQIFGTLYNELTPTVFFEKLLFKNVDQDLKIIIRLGIEKALDDTPKKS